MKKIKSWNSKLVIYSNTKGRKREITAAGVDKQTLQQSNVESKKVERAIGHY